MRSFRCRMNGDEWGRLVDIICMLAPRILHVTHFRSVKNVAVLGSRMNSVHPNLAKDRRFLRVTL